MSHAPQPVQPLCSAPWRFFRGAFWGPKLTAANVQQAIEKANPKVISLGNLVFLVPGHQPQEALKTIGNVVVKMGQPVYVVDVASLSVRDTLPVNEGYAGYTYGYNRPLLAQRVHDVLTAVAHAKGHEKAKQVHLEILPAKQRNL